MGKFTNALVLMRIPFSIFLMPIFWFALIAADQAFKNWENVVLIFFILHVLVYPASNGYNSYFDKDEEAIGGLEKPPKVNIELFYLVVIFDILSIALSLFISLEFALCIFIYLMVSKAYSWDKIRLKKYPILSTLVVTIFQGSFVYILINLGLSQFLIWNTQTVLMAITSTLFLMGSYPITQIYQHNEDTKRGDKTLSLLLGIKGTFIFSGAVFLLATGLMMFTFFESQQHQNIIIFLVATFPILWFFSKWAVKCFKNPSSANFKNTMSMNKISSICLSAAFIIMKLNLFA
ncbi:MAG: UbiA family prenyltransferase [Bacteroidia bacterium]